MNATVSDNAIRELCTLTNRDHAGRHFTQWSLHYGELEAAGLISICRPIHDQTGIPYGQDAWHLEVSEDGQAMVDERTDLHPTSLTFDDVKQCYLRAYRDLQEEKGETAPNSWTWLAPTLDDLYDEMGDDEPTVESEVRLGDAAAPVIAYVYEANGHMVTIHDGAGAGAIYDLFRLCMGFED